MFSLLDIFDFILLPYFDFNHSLFVIKSNFIIGSFCYLTVSHEQYIASYGQNILKFPSHLSMLLDGTFLSIIYSLFSAVIRQKDVSPQKVGHFLPSILNIYDDFTLLIQ